MRPARIIATVVFAAAIALTGCSVHSKAAQPSPPQTAPNPIPVDRTQVDRQALIYAAVLRQYLTSGDATIAADYRFPQIFVIDHAVPGAGASGQGTSGGGPIPPAARRAITHALTDVGPLTFVASGDEAIEPHSCAQVRDDGILITLGPVDGTGDRVQVGVNGHMGCLGANSLTYEVQQTSSGWMVSGITALGPVA
jgi:hypothetical protein